jgi:small subunit ribosomal protein S6
LWRAGLSRRRCYSRAPLTGVPTRPADPIAMPPLPTIYDLTLLLSMSADDEARAKILADVENAISTSGGTLERNQNWGTRPMTYEIRHESEAEYHLLQFAGPTSLLESLEHSLRIADEVLRFRIIKVLPGTPPAPDSPPPLVGVASAPAGTPDRADRGERGDRGDRGEY